MGPSWKLKKNQSELILNAEDDMARTLSHDVVLITEPCVTHASMEFVTHTLLASFLSSVSPAANTEQEVIQQQQ